jgi:mannose-6-phosphate isomerase-like protein (cupin superfamily)
MPVIGKNGTMPQWCELKRYEIMRPSVGKPIMLPYVAGRMKLMIAEGSCTIRFAGQAVSAEQGDQLDVAADGVNLEVEAVEPDTVLIWLAGSWGEEIGAAGFFTVVAAEEPGNDGDPADYPRNTKFDRHYHDCDEYYVIYEGSGTVAIGERLLPVKAGDCVAIGMGWHHDIPQVKQTIKAIYMETTLQGQKRTGHLWNHTHGPAVPVPDRK